MFSASVVSTGSNAECQADFVVIKGDGCTLLGWKTAKVLGLLHVGSLQANSMEKLICDKNGKHILAEAFDHGSKLNFLNIYAPNDRTQRVKFLRDLSTSTLNQVVNKRCCLVEISIAP